MTISVSTVRVGELGAYLAEPEAGSTGGMLVLPMVTGIGEQVRTFAEDVARAGITALCWDPFHGASTDTHSRDDLFGMMAELDDETALREQRTLLDHLHSERGCSAVGTIGYCLGGRFAFLLAAADPRVRAVVAYHPTVPAQPAANHTMDPFEAVRRITAPVLMHYPGQDTLVPWESFRKLQEGLQSRTDVDTVVHLYPQAEHGFSDSSRHGNDANRSAYAYSWPQSLSFIQTALSDAPT